MNESEIRKIEKSLRVTLPETYRTFLKIERDADHYLDDTTIVDEADIIIQATLDYRKGFEGLKAWPEHLIFVGDEADACPYAINCLDGKFIRTDKGNIERNPLESFDSFESFIKQRQREENEDVSPETIRTPISFYKPFVIAFSFIFLDALNKP